MRYIYGVFLFLFLFAFNANAQYLSTSSTIDITANTTFTGGSLSGSAIVTIKSGAVVTFTGSFSLSNSAQFIIEPGAKVIITTGGLSLSNNAIVTVNGALAVRGGGMSISNNTSISFSGVNKDTIIGNVNFSNNVVTGVGAGTDLYINGNLTASNNSGFDVDGLLAINGSISTSNNTTFTGDGDVTTTGSMVGGNNSNMFGTEPFNCATGPCSGRDFCSAYNNTLSSSTKVGACSGATFTITANTVASSAYLWQSTTSLGSAWSNASGTNNSVNYSSSGLSATTYYRRRMIVSGCTTYSSVVTVYAAPPPAPTASSTPFCGSGTSTLTAYNSPSSYQWYTASSGATSISGATNSTYTTPTISSSTTYYVTSVVGNCESITRTAVTAGPIGPPTVTNNAQCGSGNITLTAFGSPTGVQRWYTAASGGSPVNTTSIYTFWTSTTVTYYVSSVLGACESARVPVTATVLSSLSTPTITTNSPLCAGGTLNLSTGTVAGATYAWTGPNSFTSGAQNPSISPTTTAMSGTYSLTVSASGCTSANATKSVTINTAPAITAQPSTSTQTLCSSATATAISVTATGAGLTYQWYSNTSNSNSGGTIISGATLASYTPSVTGAKYYYCIVSGTCTPAATSNVSGLITINTAPAITAQPSTSTQTLCSSATATAISVTATGAGLTYQWYSNTSNSNSGGTSISGATLASYTPSVTGAKYYYCIVSGTCTPAATSNVSGLITINTAPAITAQPSTSTQTLCSSATATAISVTATGAGLSYQWYSNTSNSNSGGTIISGATLASYTPTVTGAQYYYCIVGGTCTPAVTSNVSGLITINTAPAITAQPSTSTQTLCSSATATAISVTATGAGLSYQWYSNTSNSNSGGTSISGATLASYTPSVTGAKYYYCIVSGTCTPAATSNVSGLITINTVPAAPTAGSNSPVCTGNAINLTASTVSGATYSWTGPNSYTSTTQNPSIASATTAMGGTYSVYSIVSGCTSTAGTVTVTVNTTPSTPSAGSNSPVYEEATINLTASATTPAATSYSWTGPNSFTSSTQNPSITNATIAMGGTYSVTATAANGCTSATGTVVVVVNPLTFSWTGNSNSVWNNTGNWSSGMVPNNTRTVTIPTGRPNYPNLASESGDINNITIQSGASVTIGTGANFTVRGDLTNDGSFTGTGTSRLFLSGSSSGTVSGNSISISNLTMSKSSGSGTLSTTVTVNGAIDLVLGTLNSNGYLILNLDNGYINQGGAGSISGNMTVTRTVSTYRTHYFSVPLDGATVADLTDDAQVFNPTNGMSRLFQYNETTNAWDRITNNVAPLIKGKGYSLYFTAPTVIDITGTYDHSYVHNVTLTNTANTWRFVGNPYPAPINWDAVSGWTKTNLNNAIAFWEGASGQYMYYVAGAGTTAGSLTASSIIPSCVGFWVQTSGTGGATSSLSMTSSVISTTPVVMYRDIDMSNMYSLKLSNGTVTDEAIIRFNDGADPSFEPMVDSKKINNTGTIPSLGSTMLGSTMSINTMPVPTVETEIPLYVKVASNGNYTLTWSNKSNPLYGAQLFLYDKKLGTSTAVVEDVAYTITQSTTDSTNRYVLKLVPAIPITPTTPGTPTTPPQSLTTGTQNALQSSVRVYAKDGKVYVEGVGSGSKEIEGEIITVGGTSLDHFTGVIGEGVSVSRTLTQVSSAVYLVRITSEGQQATYRVVMY